MLFLLSSVELTPTLTGTLVLGIVGQFIFNGVVSLFIYRSKKQDDEVAKLKQRVDDQHRGAHDLTQKLVDERFRAMSHSINNHVQALVSTVDALKARLQDGDGEMRSLNAADHKIELQTLAQLSELKTYIVEHAASKSDLKEHQKAMGDKVDRIESRLGSIERTQGGRKNAP